MCGVVGYFVAPGGSTPSRDVVRAMARALEHRGPDDEGFFEAPGIALGSRRLAIVDRAQGRQPLSNETSDLHLVCNGEIYNAPEWRARLAGEHRFRTRSDCEVLLHGFESRGPAFLENADGMFAFALWDETRGRLHLGRDRAGEKPLYYGWHSGTLYFASEIGALRAVPRFPFALDPEALRLYLMLGYFPGPRTPFAGIRKLEPGSFATIDRAAPTLSVRRYWDPRPLAVEGARRTAPIEIPREAAEELRALLETAVSRQLAGEAPIGVALSGGLDSGWIAATAARTLGPALTAFTLSFHDRGFDESGPARDWARRLGIPQIEVPVGAEELEEAAKILGQRLDEPQGDPAVLPTYLLARRASREVRVLLSGEGADELFGGYPTYLGHGAATRFLQWPPPLRAALRAIVERWPSSNGKVTLDYLLKRFLRDVDRPPLERHLAWFGVLRPEEAAALAGPALLGGCDRLADRIAVCREDLARVLTEQLAPISEWGAELPAAMPYLDFRTYLAEGLLSKLDRASMLSSVEGRAPFLDRAVIEFALRLPYQWKVRGHETKRILRRAAAASVPADLLRRRKRGLSVPLASLFRTGWRERATSAIVGGELEARGLVAPDGARALLAEHVAGKQDRHRAIWSLFALSAWARSAFADPSPGRESWGATPAETHRAGTSEVKAR